MFAAMKPARLAVLAVAILSGGGAVLMMRRSEPPPAPAPQAPQPVNMSHVLVAGADLPMGQTLRAPDLRWQLWPADAVPAGLITKGHNPDGLEQTVGSIARNGFLRGEPIRRERLIKADGSGFMSAILPPGMRAVAISIDHRGSTSAGGFILPNDRVDVLRTSPDEDASRAGGGSVHVAETILSNIRVLAIGQTIQERNGEKVVTGETATLELTPAQAEAVTLAQKVGQLSLSLRSLADAGLMEELKEERDAGLTIVRHGVPKYVSKR
jgi:pilus assembly protein CpaB